MPKHDAARLSTTALFDLGRDLCADAAHAHLAIGLSRALRHDLAIVRAGALGHDHDGEQLAVKKPKSLFLKWRKFILPVENL